MPKKKTQSRDNISVKVWPENLSAIRAIRLDKKNGLTQEYIVNEALKIGLQVKKF